MRGKWRRILEFGGLAIAVFVAGFAAGALVVYGLHKQHWLGDKEPRKPAAFSDVPEPKAGELAHRFRPRLQFDSGEHWRPLNVARVFQEGDHRFCEQAGHCKRLADELDLKRQADESSAFGKRSYIDLNGQRVDDYRGPEHCAERRLFDCGTRPRSAIYYHVTQSNQRYYVDYWWFLRFNNFERAGPEQACRTEVGRKQQACDEHEGDWEGVTVVTPPGTDSTADYVVYAAHKGTFRYTGAELGLSDAVTRPRVFVARGSHASYPQPCAKRSVGPFAGCKQPIALQGLEDLPEEPSDGTRPWGRNEENCPPNAVDSCLISLMQPPSYQDPRPWTVWTGLWGAGCEAVCRGAAGPASPRSPGLQPRYQTPWCSRQAGVFTCDGVALTCSDWLGPLVAAVACEPGRLADANRDPKRVEAGSLTIAVRGEARSRETTPGVVQTLGDPLKPGERVTVTGAAADIQVLLRAQKGPYVLDARFDDLGLDRRGRVDFVVEADDRDRPVIHVDPEGDPVEFQMRKIEQRPAGGGS